MGCIVSGIVRDVKGIAFVNTPVKFIRVQPLAQDGTQPPPIVEEALSDGAGFIEIDLDDGNWTLVAAAADRSFTREIGVPDAAEANLGALIGAPEVYIPAQNLTDAIAAKDAAEAAAAIALAGSPFRVPTFAALSRLTYGTPTGNQIRVAADDIVDVPGIGNYRVAASTATDHHVTTAGGVKLYVLPGADGVNIEAAGAVASSSQAYKTSNIAAIRAAKTAALANGCDMVIPKRETPFVVDDHISLSSADNGLRIRGGGKLKLANVLNSSNAISPWLIYFYDRTTAMQDIKIEDIELDGNRASVTLSGSPPATSFGVWIDQRSLLGDGIEINNVTADNFITSGFQVQQGPVVLRFPTARGNGAHGIAFNNDPLGMLFSGWASIVSPRTSDNEGYGVDFSGGKVLCVDSVDEGSWFGNAKASVGLEHLIVRGAHWLNSPGNPSDALSGRGFLTTGTAVDFANATMDLDGIYIEGATGPSFTISAYNGILNIGSIITKNGSPSIVATEQGDIQIGAARFTADRLEVYGSDANGIVVTGGCVSYNIGHIESRRASRAGFTCRATTGGDCHGIIRGGVMVENNQAALAAEAGAAVQHIVAGSCKVDGVEIFDLQGSPTQVAGMYFGGGVQADVDQCRFGTGIAAGGQVYSVTAGTRVRFGNGNTGVVTRARGVRTGNGGAAAQNLTFPTAFSALGGATFFAQVTPSSADAAGDFYITSISTTVLGVTYAVAPSAGTDNVSYHYDVTMEIQR